MTKFKIYSLFSGSKGNCSLLIYEDLKILIDAGGSKTRIVSKLADIGYSTNDISHVLITHSHYDHIKALNSLNKLAHVKTYLLSDTLTACYKYLDVPLNKVELNGEFDIDCVHVVPIKVSHDVPCVGYVFSVGLDKFAYMTDLGCFNDEYYDYIKGAQKLFIESNHDEAMVGSSNYPYPLKKRILSPNGHLSNEDCSEVCKKMYQMGTRCFILGHLSEENNLPELAYDITYKAISSVANNEDFKLFVALKEGTGKII